MCAVLWSIVLHAVLRDAVRVSSLVGCLHNAVQHSVVSHCAHPTVPVDIWATCNSVSWDNSTLGLVVWIGIDS